MSEKTRMLAIGTVVNIAVIIITVLVTAYFGNFESKADSKASDVRLESIISLERSEREKEVALMQKDIDYIKKGIDEIKRLLKK